MTTAGVGLVIALGLVMILWVGTLLWHERLYAGYAVLLIFLVAVTIGTIAEPSLRHEVTALTDALMPAPSLVLIPLVLLAILLVYVFTQLSILANRVTAITQALAIRDIDQQRLAAHESTKAENADVAHNS